MLGACSPCSHIGASCEVDCLQLKPDPFRDLATLRLLGVFLKGIIERKRGITVVRRSKMVRGRLSALDEDGLFGGSAPKAEARQMRNMTGMNLPTLCKSERGGRDPV